MNVEVIEAGPDLMPVILNLGRYYTYDFTQFIGFRCPDSGLYRTDIWEKYWTEDDRWPFLLKVDGELAGFAFVGPDGTQPDSQYDIGEFFIMRKFRGRGVGQHVAFDVFDRFRGRWEVRQAVQNAPATAFWRKVVDRYTRGNYHELPEPVQSGEWTNVVQTFDNTK